jgi:MFS family permease
MVQLVAFSILASSFPNTREKVFGYSETASGIGLLSGPILGEFMYNQMGGYFPSFLAFVGLEMVIGILCIFLLPATFNKKPVISNEEL